MINAEPTILMYLICNVTVICSLSFVIQCFIGNLRRSTFSEILRAAKHIVN